MSARVTPLVRNLAILALLAGAVTAAGRVGGLVLAILIGLAKLAFLVALGMVAYSVWRQNRGTFQLMSARLRLLLYGSVLLLVAVVLTADFWVSSFLTAVAFFVVIGGLGFVIYRVWEESRRYYY